MESPLQTLLSRSWKWFIIVGGLIAIAGISALVLPVIAGMTVTTIVGGVFLFIGLVQAYHTFSITDWKIKMWYVLGAVLYIVGGLFILFEPLAGLITLTMLMVVIMVFTGATRVIFGFSNRSVSGSSWMIFSGILSVVIGVYFFSLLENPEFSKSLLGLYIGISLLIEGISFILMGLQMRRVSKKL